MSSNPVGRFIKLGEVLAIVNISQGTLRVMEASGRFPKRRRVGLRAVRWWLPDVEAWLKNPETWQAE